MATLQHLIAVIGILVIFDILLLIIAQGIKLFRIFNSKLPTDVILSYLEALSPIWRILFLREGQKGYMEGRYRLLVHKDHRQLAFIPILLNIVVASFFVMMITSAIVSAVVASFVKPTHLSFLWGILLGGFTLIRYKRYLYMSFGAIPQLEENKKKKNDEMLEKRKNI